jgi:hypothetical protein
MMPLGSQGEAIRDGDLSPAFFASVDLRVWRGDTSIMKVIKFAAAIEGQQSQKFVRCHRPSEFKLRRRGKRTAFSGLEV